MFILLRKMFPSLFGQTQPAAPAPAPAPAPPPVVAPVTGTLIDTSTWQGQPTSDWVREGTAIHYNGRNNQPLESPRISAKEGDLESLAVTVACDEPYGTQQATGALSITAYYADGRSIDTTRLSRINAGGLRCELRMPAKTDHYVIRLHPANTTESGTYDPSNPDDIAYSGKRLLTRFVNLRRVSGAA